MPLNGIYVDQFVGRAEAQYDLRKFHFIGSPAVESNIFYMRADAPYKSIADMIKAKEPPKCGGTGTASSDYILSKILEDTVGAKFNSVLGYAGGTEIDIAVEKGEVVCRAHSLSAHFGREPFDSWHKKNFDRHLVQTARKRDSNAARYADTQRDFRSVQSSGEQPPRRANSTGLGRFRPSDHGDAGHSGGPGENFARCLSQDYERSRGVAEAKKGRMDIEPTTGEELEALVKEIFDSPPEVIERAKKMLAQ